MSTLGFPSSVGVSHPSESTRQHRTLSGLSDRELLSRVKDLASRERAVTLEILVHLIEVERRSLHLGLGYASMFDYCTGCLGYSSSAAGRRIAAARCIRDYPEIHGLLEKNEVTLITVSLVSSILNASNAKDLIERIKGRYQREVEAIAATYRPPVSMRDRVKPVCVAITDAVADPVKECDRRCAGTPSAGSEISPNMVAAGGAGGPLQARTVTQAPRQASTQRSDVHPTPRLEQKFLVQFLASGGFMKKLERAKALLSNKNGGHSFEAVFEAALDEFLKDHDPEERNKRREERKEKAEVRSKSEDRATRRTAGSRAEGGIGSAGSGQADDPLFRRWIGGLPASRVETKEEPPRHIPAATRDTVFARDKGRCTYVAANGSRCAATHHLQIDHIVPYARGGTNSVQNLRLLCERHNKHEAERVLGANAMNKFRARE